MTTTTTERPRRGSKAATPPPGEGEGETGGEVFAGAVVARADLLSAAAVASIVETKNIVPILGNMMIEAGGDELAVTSTDLDMVVRVAVPARVSGSGFATTVGARKLAALVGGAEDGCDISLTMPPGGRDVEMRAARGRYKLPVLPKEDFPVVAFVGGGQQFTIGAEAFRDALARTANCESDEETRYYLIGTMIGEMDGRLIAVATNGHVLAEVDLAPAPEGWPRSILPSKLTALLVRLLKDEKGDVSVALDPSGHRIRIEWGAWTVTSKLVSGDFPEWRRVIPPSSGARVMTIDSGELRRAVARVTQLANEKTRKVVLDIAADRLTVACASAEHGTGEEDVAASAAFGDLRVGVNAAYLRDIAAAASDDSVTFEFGDDPKAPIRVEPQPAGGFVGVLMPMNV